MFILQSGIAPAVPGPPSRVVTAVGRIGGDEGMGRRLREMSHTSAPVAIAACPGERGVRR